jgi:hypothetical protein
MHLHPTKSDSFYTIFLHELLAGLIYDVDDDDDDDDGSCDASILLLPLPIYNYQLSSPKISITLLIQFVRSFLPCPSISE